MPKDIAATAYRQNSTNEGANQTNALEGIDAVIESAACTYLLASDEEEEEYEEDHIPELIAIQEVIASQRYLSRDGSAGCVESLKWMPILMIK